MLWNWCTLLHAMNCLLSVREGRSVLEFPLNLFGPLYFQPCITDEGVRVTGLDVELIREVADALTTYCGGQKPIVPTLHLTRFRDLFIEMNEGHLDLFVSSDRWECSWRKTCRPVVFNSVFS